MSELISILRTLRAAGSDGFEGLIANLLESLTGFHYSLAKSGSQAGRDLSSRHPNGNIVAVECKRYGKDTDLDERELLGELVQVEQAIPDLDLWVLVTTRDIPSQLSESLNRFASEKGLGFLTLSSGDGSPSSLEVLCANDPAAVVAHASAQTNTDPEDIRTILRTIYQHGDYQQRRTRLKEYFSSPLSGYENWRSLQNSTFLHSLRSGEEARASYGQPINVEEHGVLLVKREAAWAGLAKWHEDWKDQPLPLATLGEEGDGKTWAVASWLSEQIKRNEAFPAVEFLSSSDISAADSGNDLRSLFAGLISRQLPAASTEQCLRRLDRWLERPKHDAPLILLVLDGVNERGDPTFWRKLLENLTAEKWNTTIAVVITCRSSYWERYFKKLRHLATSSLVVGPYNDVELDLALGHHQLQRHSLQDTILPLIRKPRYFDLMLRHHDQIAESGDVTVSRLLFEDWRDRWERKQTIALTNDDFQNLIRELAQRYQSANHSFQEHEVTDALPTLFDRQLILEELRTGGILHESKGRYKVNEELLVLGLGLLLVDQLEKATASAGDPRETIATWMEPHADMDLKASICEFAALYVLGSNILPLDFKVALLESWISNHNAKTTSGSDLSAYLPRDPLAYVALAEAVWCDSYDNRWAQETLTQSFLRWFEYSSVSTLLRNTFERWLGLVHIEGSPLRRSNSEERERNRQEIAERLGRDVELGPLQLGEYDLTVIEDDGHLRLSKVAFAVISHFQRNQFMRALAIGCLADVIMGRPANYELSSWVVRSSPIDVWPELKLEVDQLLAIDNDIARKAASRMLSFEGSSAAFNLESTIQRDRSTPSIIKSQQEDPCRSMMQWDREDCITCLQREDLNLEWMARQIRPFAIDPSLPVPQSFLARLSALLNNIKTDHLWALLGTTSEDHLFESVEPILAAQSPKELAEFVRLMARSIINRQGLERRQLSVNLGKHYLILLSEEQEAAEQVWENLILTANNWSRHDEEAEFFLFEAVIPNLAAEKQLSALTRRPDRSWDLVVYENSFLPIISFDAVRDNLTDTSDAEVLHRTLWFLAAHPSAVPVDLLTTVIIPLLNHDDAIVRSKVLELTYKIKDTDAINRVVNGSWTCDLSSQGFQNHWGSLILCEHGQALPFDELSRRVDPSYLGYAVTCRDNDTYEVQQYAELVHQIWLRLTKSNADLPLDLPRFSVQSSYTKRTQYVPRWSLNDSSERSLTFASKYDRRGGLGETEETSFEDWNADSAVERRRKVMSIIHEAIEQQKQAGNVWFGKDFRGNALDQVVAERPDLVDTWISSIDTANAQAREYIQRGSSFCDALCTTLLDKEPMKGVKLYWQLQESDARIPVVDSDTEIDLLDFALFEAVSNEHLVAAWQRTVEQCWTDQQLMRVAVLLQHGTGVEWLWSYIETRIHSTIPIHRARSRVLLGFFDTQEASVLLDDLLLSEPDTWALSLVKTAKQRQVRRNWGKYWFNQFLSVKDDDTSWASFRLLLHCVDTSFWFWRESAEGAGVATDQRRLTFLENNADNIQKAAQKNEKAASEHFLGQKLLQRQVWPWM